jgi:hypothetical protein
MNDACRRKACIYRGICTSMYDLTDCSAYKRTGTVPEQLKAVGPIDRQASLFPRNEEHQNPAPARARRKQV